MENAFDSGDGAALSRADLRWFCENGLVSGMVMSGTFDETPLRAGEVATALPEEADESVYFIGRIRTPWKSRSECPRQGDAAGGPVCRIEVADIWQEALAGIESNARLQILYWMHHARRDLIRQCPKSHARTKGTFAIRSPNRPNPIASSVVSLLGVEGNVLVVRGLDCVDGTPVVDIKPEYSP